MADAAGDGTDDGVVTKTSPSGVGETVDRFVEILGERGITVFTVIDQAAEATRAGLDLRATVLVVFGSPAAGTPVMEAAPLAALDLPLKVLVWDDAGETRVSYRPPVPLARGFGVTPEVAAPLGAVDVLTDALVAP